VRPLVQIEKGAVQGSGFQGSVFFFFALGQVTVQTPRSSLNENMAQLGLPKFWPLKESIRSVEQIFIDEKPEFEDFILSYCTEIDQYSPSNAQENLRVLFARLDTIDDLDAKRLSGRR
jgi:hypothetical protein